MSPLAANLFDRQFRNLVMTAYVEMVKVSWLTVADVGWPFLKENPGQKESGTPGSLSRATDQKSPHDIDQAAPKFFEKLQTRS